MRCYEIEAASVLSPGNPCQSYFSRICICGPVGEHSNDLRLSVFLCIYKQTSISCAASKSSYFWFWRRFNSEHKVLQELSHFSPFPGELWCSDMWSELTRSEVCCIAVITVLNEWDDLCSQRNLCYRPCSLHWLPLLYSVIFPSYTTNSLVKWVYFPALEVLR